MYGRIARTSTSFEFSYCFKFAIVGGARTFRSWIFAMDGQYGFSSVWNLLSTWEKKKNQVYTRPSIFFSERFINKPNLKDQNSFPQVDPGIRSLFVMCHDRDEIHVAEQSRKHRLGKSESSEEIHLSNWPAAASHMSRIFRHLCAGLYESRARWPRAKEKTYRDQKSRMPSRIGARARVPRIKPTD